MRVIATVSDNEVMVQLTKQEFAVIQGLRSPHQKNFKPPYVGQTVYLEKLGMAVEQMKDARGKAKKAVAQLKDVLETLDNLDIPKLIMEE